jgi:hypothetical protein
MLRAVIHELDRDVEERELATWLGTLLPGEADIEELGFGAWLRSVDEEVVPRVLDIRNLTPANQRRFNNAARRALDRMLLNDGSTPIDRDFLPSLNDFVTMIDAATRGDPPLEMSDIVLVKEPSGDQLGPGWVP